MFVISCTSLYKLRNGLIAWHPISNYFATTQLHVVLNLVHIPDNFVSRGGVLYSQICVKYRRRHPNANYLYTVDINKKFALGCRCLYILKTKAGR